MKFIVSVVAIAIFGCTGVPGVGYPDDPPPPSADGGGDVLGGDAEDTVEVETPGDTAYMPGVPVSGFRLPDGRYDAMYKIIGGVGVEPTKKDYCQSTFGITITKIFSEVYREQINGSYWMDGWYRCGGTTELVTQFDHDGWVVDDVQLTAGCEVYSRDLGALAGPTRYVIMSGDGIPGAVPEDTILEVRTYASEWKGATDAPVVVTRYKLLDAIVE